MIQTTGKLLLMKPLFQSAKLWILRRYKMPQMKLSQESRLNGVKTNITNLPDVARALRIPESAILKYFCVEVGANSEGTSIVKGQHTLADLSQKLEK